MVVEQNEFMRPQRILLTTHLFLPEFFGGTETLVRDVAIALKEKGHEVLVVTGYPMERQPGLADHFDEYRIDDLRVVRFNYQRAPLGGPRNPMRDDYANPVFEQGFCKLLDEFKPGIVHFHHFGRLSIRAIDACDARGIPTLFTATDFWAICPTQALLLSNGAICEGPDRNSANCLKHIVGISQPAWVSGIIKSVPIVALGGAMKLLEAHAKDLSGRVGVVQALAKRGEIIGQRFHSLRTIFVPTRHAQMALEKSGLGHGKFRILPFGIKNHGYVKRTRVRTGNDLVLGFIGQFLPHKGLHILVEAIRLLPSDLPVQVKIYGKFPDNETVYSKDLIRNVQEDKRLEFCGIFENAKIPVILDGLDALVIPSMWHENMPLVSLSAQAAGCPLIASDIGGLSDIVTHERNGLLFKPGTAGQLRDRILRLLTDADLLKHLSDAAITPLNIDQYVDALEVEYRQAIGEAQ
jgi:glycosyltransferase involved in cell wall biosynthesis